MKDIEITAKLVDAFKKQKANAKFRGIAWQISVNDWAAIWQASGFLHLRGKGKDKYCMARNGDKGPYRKDNVKIMPFVKNVIEAQLGRKADPAACAAISAGLKGKPSGMLGRKHTEETKLKISLTRLATNERLLKEQNSVRGTSRQDAATYIQQRNKISLHRRNNRS